VNGAPEARVVVLDDDPTGTQGVSGLPIVLRPDGATLGRVRREWGGPVWVLTNTRAMPEADADETVRSVAAAVRAEFEPGTRLVLRGDSTLRGHVLTELDALGGADTVSLFVPAFLEAGRVTVGGVHYTEVEGRRLEVAATEYARDHEFGYRSSRLTDWVAERDPERVAIPVAAEVIRAKDGADAVRDILLSAPPGAVVVPDAETVDDLTTIASGWELANASGREVLLRCAASLASVVTDSPPHHVALRPAKGPVLVVCASHTTGARDQLAALAAEFSPAQIEVNLTRAVDGDAGYATELANEVTVALRNGRVVVLATPRGTDPRHQTLTAGEAIMDAVIGAVSRLGIRPGLVISKGGITGARVARDGFAAASATVLGQPFTGVPLWQLDLPDRGGILQLVVPGNVGAPGLIADAVRDALAAARG
jgi:uncharacterized protein YgbK (DUF1537 family)